MLPSFVERRFNIIQQRTSIDRAELVGAYSRIFNDPFIQNDEVFTCDDDRQRYAAIRLMIHFINEPQKH